MELMSGHEGADQNEGGEGASSAPPMGGALTSQITPCQRGRKALRSWSPSPTLACQAGAG